MRSDVAVPTWKTARSPATAMTAGSETLIVTTADRTVATTVDRILAMAAVTAAGTTAGTTSEKRLGGTTTRMATGSISTAIAGTATGLVRFDTPGNKARTRAMPTIAVMAVGGPKRRSGGIGAW